MPNVRARPYRKDLIVGIFVVPWVLFVIPEIFGDVPDLELEGFYVCSEHTGC